VLIHEKVGLTLEPVWMLSKVLCPSRNRTRLACLITIATLWATQVRHSLLTLWL